LARDWNPHTTRTRKINRPADRSGPGALLAGLNAGIIDAIATDHAPHAIEDKLQEFDDAAFGIGCLETAVASVLTLVSAANSTGNGHPRAHLQPRTGVRHRRAHTGGRAARTGSVGRPGVARPRRSLDGGSGAAGLEGEEHAARRRGAHRIGARRRLRRDACLRTGGRGCLKLCWSSRTGQSSRAIGWRSRHRGRRGCVQHLDDGYQEMLTDPSYAGQLGRSRIPLIGNYVLDERVEESARIQPAG